MSNEENTKGADDVLLNTGVDPEIGKAAGETPTLGQLCPDSCVAQGGASFRRLQRIQESICLMLRVALLVGGR